jgi:cellulose synthase operon protein C
MGGELNDLRTRCERQPQDPRAWYEYAIAAFQTDDLATALAAARNAARLSDEVAYLSLCGRLELVAGELNAAQDLLRRVVKTCPEDVDARSGLGLTLFASGNLSAARQAFDAVLGTVPNHEEALIGRVRVALAERDLGLAAQTCIDALEAECEDPGAFLLLLGEAVLMMGDIPRAIGIYKNATEVQPDNAAAWVALINIHLMNADFPAAESALRRTQAIFPGKPEFLLLTAQVALQREKVREAQIILEQLVENHPDFVDARVSLAALELAEGNADQAERVITPALKLSEERPDAALVAANIAEARQDFEAAIRHARSAVAGMPENYHARLSLGRGLASTGELRSARVELNAALALASNEVQRASAQRLIDALS